MPAIVEKGHDLRLMSPSGRWIGVMLGAAFCAFNGRAEAQEYCIACTQPNVIYRCIIEGAKPGGSQPLQMLCVTAMLKEGRHATCSPKGGTVFDCNGPVKRVSWAAHNAPVSPPMPEAATQPPKAPNQPPKTVEEMAKRVNEKSAEDLKKANETIKDQATSIGQNVGDATKKTWRCIATLFTSCTD
jgi:hypothetical protein